MKKKILVAVTFIVLVVILAAFPAMKMEAKTVSSCKKAERLIRRKYEKKGRKVKIYKTANLTNHRLKTRKDKKVVIVEKVTGTVLNARTGDGRAAGWYVNYKSVKGIHKGSKVTSYFVYNPRSNYIDDIIGRYDVVTKR